LANQSVLEKKYSSYFLLDEGKLRKLGDVLKEFASKKDYECGTVYTVKKADNSEYTSDTIDTVLHDDNIKRKEIQKLTISLADRSEEFKWQRRTDCTIEFDQTIDADNRYGFPVRYSVKDNDERWAFAFSEGLDGYIQRTMMSNKMRLRPISSFFEAIVPVLGFMLVILMINSLYPLRHRLLGELNLLEFGILVPICIGLVILCFDTINWLKPIERLSNLVRHSSVFYWGDQKEIYDSQRNFRQNMKWVVLIGFIVSVAAGILVAFLLNR